MELTVKLLRTLDAVIAHVEKARARPRPSRPPRPFPPASRRLPILTLARRPTAHLR